MEHEEISILGIEQKSQYKVEAYVAGIIFLLLLIYILLCFCPVSFGDYLTAGLLLSFLILIIRGIWLLKNITLTDEELLIRQIVTGKKRHISLNEVLFWAESDDTEPNLYIYTSSQKIKISSSQFHNYTALKRIITTGRDKNHELEVKLKRRQQRKFAVWTLILALYFFRLAYFNHFNAGHTLSSKDLYTIRDVIEKIDIQHKSKGGTSVHLELSRYKGIRFNIPNTDYKTWFLETVQSGDSVQLYVTKSDYNTTQKCVKAYSSGMYKWMIWRPDVVSICGLSALGNEYFVLEQTLLNRKIGILAAAWLFTLLASLLGLGAIGMLITNPTTDP